MGTFASSRTPSRIPNTELLIEFYEGLHTFAVYLAYVVYIVYNTTSSGGSNPCQGREMCQSREMST